MSNHVSVTKQKCYSSAVAFLKTSIKNDRLSHAYIFLGPSGVGKRAAALYFAKILNCGSALSGEPCEACPSCLKINSLSHPDISVISPDKEGSSIKIDDIRALIKDIYLKPFEARKKVYIIERADHMKHEAANALLKTLEEPPTDSILILIAEDLNSLFHTIVSRSQVVRFFPLKNKDIENILTEEYALDATAAHVLAQLSGGRLGEALKFREGDAFSKRSALINKLSSGAGAEMDFDGIAKEDVRFYLDILLTWFRDIINTKARADETLLVNIDKKDIITNEAKRLSFDYLEDVLNGIEATYLYLDQSVNQKLAMNVLSNKINRIGVCTK